MTNMLAPDEPDEPDGAALCPRTGLRPEFCACGADNCGRGAFELVPEAPPS